MADLSSFEHYLTLTDTLIEQSTKEQLAECARLLAFNLAHHEALHGEIPWDQTLAILAEEPSPAQLQLLTDGMENLVGGLGNVMSGLGEEKH